MAHCTKLWWLSLAAPGSYDHVVGQSCWDGVVYWWTREDCEAGATGELGPQHVSDFVFLTGTVIPVLSYWHTSGKLAGACKRHEQCIPRNST